MLAKNGYQLFSIHKGLFGPILRPLQEQPKFRRESEGENFRATLEPQRAIERCAARGWSWRVRPRRDPDQVDAEVGAGGGRPPRGQASAPVQDAVPDLDGPRLVLAPGLGPRRPLPPRVHPGRHRHRTLDHERRRRPADPQDHPACRRRRSGLAPGRRRRRPDGAARPRRDLPRPGPDGRGGQRGGPVHPPLRPRVLRRPRARQAGAARRGVRPDVRRRPEEPRGAAPPLPAGRRVRRRRREGR